MKETKVVAPTESIPKADPSGRIVDPSSSGRIIKPDGSFKAMYDSMYAGMREKKPLTPNVDYSSVNNLTMEKKIQFLKGKDFDPSKLLDPRDQVNAVMYRWQDYTAQMQKHLLDYRGGEKTQRAIAAQFYDMYLTPAYKRLGQPAMDRKKWIENAYEIGKHYDLDYNYSDQLTYGVRGNLYGIGSTASKFIKSFVTMAGVFLSPPKPITDENWQKQLDDARKSGQKPQGFWQNAEALASTNKVFNYQANTQKLNTIRDRMDIMQQLRPNRTFIEKAGGFGIDQVPFLALSFMNPIAAAEEEFTALGLEGVTKVGAEAAPSMSENILSSVNALAGSGVRGKMAEAGLRAGTEGLIYGGLTRDTDEKSKAFEDALGWAVGAAGITGITSVGGKLIQSIGSKFFDRGKVKDYGPIDYSPWPWEQKKLTTGATEGEYVGEPPIGDLPSPEMQAAQNVVQQQQKMLSDGREPATAHEVQELSEAGVAQTVAEHGGAAQEFINNAAAAHLIKMEESGKTLEQIRQYERNLFNTGTKEDKDMLDAVTRIRGALKDRVITNLSRDEKANLIMHLQNLTNNASQKMLKYLPGLQEALKKRITSYPSGKLDQDLIKHLIPDVMKALPLDAKPEQIADAIKNKLAEATVAMHKFADEESTKNFKAEAQGAEQKRKAFVQKNKKPVSFSEITRRTKSKKGEPAVSYSINPQWIVYAKNAIRQSGRKWTAADMRSWLEDLSTDDFAADIHAYFLPEFIKNAEIRFERRGSAGKGYDYSNLFAFAWNFRNKMPTEYAERLEEELAHSPKMSKFYEEISKNKALTPALKQKATMNLIWKQSKAMWNHMDNFLNSGHFPKESHIFGSTNSYADDPTIWMEQLFNEREEYENKVIDAMYKKDTVANKNAKSMLKVMMADRRQAYKEGGLEKVKQISMALKSKLLAPGPRGGKSLAEGKIIPLAERVTHEVKNPYPAKDVQAMVKYHKELGELSRRADVDWKKFQEWQKIRDAATPDSFAHDNAKQQTAFYRSRVLEHRNEHKLLEARHNIRALNVPYYVSQGPFGSITVDSQGRTAAWFNRETMSKFYMAVQGKGPDYGAGVLGFNIGRKYFAGILRNIQNSPVLNLFERNHLDDLVRKAFDKAGPEGPTFMQADKGIEEMLDTYHEEVTHGWQRTLGLKRALTALEDEVHNHISKDAIKELLPKIPAKLRAYLDKNYPEKSYLNAETYSAVHVLEAAAKLISQGPEGYYSELKGKIPDEELARDYALSEEESIQFLKAYYDKIIQEHGDEALESLTTATSHAEKLRSEYLESRGKQVTESTRITEADIPKSGGTGQAP